MKKLVSILLALTMIFVLSISAFADTTTNLTIGDDANRTYKGYKLLSLTTSLKAGDTCTGDHNENCYNYSYTVNSTFKTILEIATGKSTDEEILTYLENSTGNMQEVADSIYREIQKANPTIQAVEINGNTATIDQGYWLFADVTNNLTDKANSLVMVDTKGQLDLQINPKTAIPTIVKKVEDVNNSTGETAWQDSADHDFGDTVSFKLTATLPANLTSYESYKLIFHDKLAEGFELIEGTIKVEMFADKDAQTGTDVTEKFNKTTAVTDDCTFEVGCNDILGVDGMTVTKDTVFVVTYDAILTEEAEIGAEGNTNVVTLEFSNDPYGTGTGEISDKVIVFTYQLVIEKTDGNAPLAGAGFQLYKLDVTTGQYVEYGAQQGEKGNNLTTFTWLGLDDGDYKLVEVVVPDGYNKMQDLTFTVSAEHDVESDDPALKSLSGGTIGDGVIATGLLTEEVINQTGTILPETGAMGTLWLIVIGSMLVVLAGVFMITRKKMSVFED